MKKIILTISLVFFSLPSECAVPIPNDLSSLNELEKCQLVNQLSHERKYFYKVEKTDLVTVVYLSKAFYRLKYDERELVAQCMYIESKSQHPSTTSITFNDDNTGKFIGIYTPEKGLTLGR